ncbi:34-kDa subunit of RNA polymerase III (C) [Coelomomyces lativittatus]|nr:34-kDa subunit of RNA polymerase III (C) [Coelomomyces lativittatus]
MGGMDGHCRMDELENEEKLVYSFIKQVGTQGIWVRTLANRTNLHQSILNKALKKLEQRQLVKTVKSVKLGNKKLYMLYELEPSKEVTGGIWFSDQALDIDFVETIARTCLRYIQQHSFPPDPLSIYPMTYPGYPTLTRITHYISTCKVANVDLTTTDIQMVLNTLLFDGLIETMAPIRKGEGRRRGPKVDEENGGRPPLLRFPSSSSSTTSVRFSTKAMGTTAPSFPYNHDAHDDDDDEEEEEDFEIDELRYRATREHRAIPRPGLAKVGSLLHAMSLAQPHVHERTTGVSGNGSSSDSTPLKASNPLIPDGQTYLNRWADY